MDRDIRSEDAAKCGQVIAQILKIYGCTLEVIVKPAEQQAEQKEQREHEQERSN